MPRCCSVPGCKSGHKQGLSLLCFPKDAQRRAAWLRALKSNGMEPTNNRFVCELHFGPNQWEKVRVDGTRKLKWSGVPNILDPAQIEEARERVKLRPKKATAPSKPPPDFPRIVIQKVFKLEKDDKSASQSSNSTVVSSLPPSASSHHTFNEKGVSQDMSSAQQDSQDLLQDQPLDLPRHPVHDSLQSPLLEPLQDACIKMEVNIEMPQSQTNLSEPVLKNLIGKPASLSEDSGMKLDTQQTPNNPIECERQSVLQCTLPLSNKDHTIVVSMPMSRFRDRLADDLEDVKSFLSSTEQTYEEKLVLSLSQLVQKHQLLDKKIQEIEALSTEHHSLKRQLEVHEAVLLENYNLKIKLEKYERQAFIENAILKKKAGDENWTTETEKIKEPIYIISQANGNSLKRVILREESSPEFVPLDDQM